MLHPVARDRGLREAALFAGATLLWVVLGLLTFLLSLHAAHAQGIAAGLPAVGPSAGVQYADEAIKAVLGVVVTGLLAWISRHVRDALLRQALNMALGRAALYAQSFLEHEAAGLDGVQARNAAVAMGVAYLRNFVPGVLGRFGLTPQHLADMLTAELTRLGVLPKGVPSSAVADPVAAAPPASVAAPVQAAPVAA